MTTNERFERGLAAWLRDDATFRVPDHLDEVLAVTRETRQRSAWSSLERWLPMDTTFRPRPFSVPSAGRLLAVAMLILLILAVAVFAIGSQHRVPPPFGLARVGTLLTWGSGDISTANPDGSMGRVVIGGPTDDLAPIPTRDGTHFAFFRALSAHEFLVMTARMDGADVRQILPDPLIDSDWWEWSADGRRLAIVNTVAGKRVLSIVDVDAGGRADLDMGNLMVDNDVYWLPPDGSRLIFTARPAGAGDQPRRIYTIRSDGTDLRAVSAAHSGPFFLGLDVSQDGRTVSYWDYEADSSRDGKGSHVHYLDLATRADRPMTFDPDAEGETDLRFSPGGDRVVLQREVGSWARLLIASKDGTGWSVLVGPSFSVDADPAYGFTPDGRTVFLVLVGRTRPYFFDAETGAETRGADVVENIGGYQRLAP